LIYTKYLTPLIALTLLACSEKEVTRYAPIIEKPLVTTQECALFSDTSCINDDEFVEMFESYASIDEGSLEAIFTLRGWIYESNANSLTRASFLTLLELEIGTIKASEKSLYSKIDPFLTDNQSGEIIKVLIGKKVYSMDPSLSSGNFSGTIRLTQEELQAIYKAQSSEEYISYKVLLPSDETRVIEGKVKVLSNSGTIVVSDVDDTIKVSEVYISNERLLQNVFVNYPRKIISTQNILTTLKEEHDTSFFYVSGSPKQLSKEIKNFIKRENFPEGFLYLKDFQLSPFTSSFFKFLDSDSTYEHKIERISKLLEEFPNKEFILIGDSGEKDPEVYGELLKKYTEQIKKIYIRNVTNESLDNERLSSAFKEGKEKLTLLD